MQDYVKTMKYETGSGYGFIMRMISLFQLEKRCRKSMKAPI